ncbi:MAG: LLM class F420-dependent oxidoreductase [bacterium TMED88]|nr:LLM class F420-dependent oxidoreductase [Deltaproteobacteria bacterium]OUV19447.1 MAG: LLM class F420-dependent oxidoreductase [bacterium TMED88]
MRFSLAESMGDPNHYGSVAQAAEAAGFSSMVVPDSLCYPEESESQYPYTPDGDRKFLEGKPFIEPFVLIPSLAAQTQKIRFDTFVLKLPVREPVWVAKQAMSIAVLSQNRLGLGVGLSPWPEDFEVTGTSWKTRGARCDEMIEIIRGLSTGDYFAYEGKQYRFPSIQMTPAPTRPIPILVGGHAEKALRRAARLGDGWMHAGGDRGALKDMIERLQALRREYGRHQEDFEIHAISLDPDALKTSSSDGISQLEEIGVTNTIVSFHNPYAKKPRTIEQKVDEIREYGEKVIRLS